MSTAATEKPLIEITSCPVATTNKKMVIAGIINSTEPELQLYINSEEKKVHNGRFMVSLPLDDGNNDFEITLLNKTEVLSCEYRSIFCGFLPPVLEVNAMPTVTASEKITLSGTGLDVNQMKSILILKINSEIVELAAETGAWSKTFSLNQGTNYFDILLYDGALRKAVSRRVIDYHPDAPEVSIDGLGVITTRKIELNGQLDNFDYNKTDIKIHNKIIPITGNTFKYMTNIRTDVAEIPFTIDFNGRPILNFTRQIVFLPSPPTVTVDNEIKQLSATHCRISGTIFDENDIDPKLFVNEKEVHPRAGIWTVTLNLTAGINTITIEGKNQSGLNKIIKKKIAVPE